MENAKIKWASEKEGKDDKEKEGQGKKKFRAVKQMPLGFMKNESVMDDMMESARGQPSPSPKVNKFNQLNQKAEDIKKVNLFYLKDILIKHQSNLDEKLECLWKMKKNV